MEDAAGANRGVIVSFAHAHRQDRLPERIPHRFQGTLQVILRAEEPFRWADVMHNLSQSLQVYGDHIKSVEVLQRSVDTSRAALEVRT